MFLSFSVEQILKILLVFLLLVALLFILIVPSIRLLLGFIKDFLTLSHYLISKIKLQNNVAYITCEASENKFRHLLEDNLQQGMILSLEENSSSIILIEKEYLNYMKLQDRIFKWDKKIYKLEFKPKY